MKKVDMMKIKLIIAVAFLGLSSSVFAQDKSFNFESKDGWWTKYKDIYSITNEKANEDDYCLKFSCNTALSEVKNIQMIRAEETIQQGTYNVTAMVWIEEGSEVNGFSLKFQKPHSTASFKFKKTPKAAWVEISSELVVTEPSKKMVIAVSTNPKWGGTGTFFIDAIKITKK